MSGRWARIRSRSVLVLGLAFFSLLVLIPIYWIIVTSLKTDAEVYANPPTFWPRILTAIHYKEAVFETALPLYFRNSVLVAVVVTAVSLIVSCIAAYSITRFRFKGRRLIGRAMLIIYLIPSSLLFIPMYVFIRRLQLHNTLFSLELVYPVFVMPYMTWLLISYFSTIPAEIEDAALVDGCSRMSVLSRVVFAMSLPGVLTVTVYAFTQSWNELLYAATFITSEKYRTLPFGLSEMLLGDQYQWGRLMAASVLMSLPVVMLYMSLQRYVVQGLTAGGVKG